MVLLSVTIRDYVINIVIRHERAHQDAHYQVAVVMTGSKKGFRSQSICSRSMVRLNGLSRVSKFPYMFVCLFVVCLFACAKYFCYNR